MAKTNGKAVGAPLWKDQEGVRLALEMLREIKSKITDEDGYEPMHIEARWRRPGVAQVNVVQAYLTRIRESGNREVEDDFTSLLTEYLNSVLGGGVPVLDVCYERLLLAERDHAPAFPRVSTALLEIERDPEQAEAILRGAFRDEPDQVISGLAVYLAAAAEGFILGPNDLGPVHISGAREVRNG